jgi:DNA-binding transcriptional MerR regulator
MGIENRYYEAKDLLRFLQLKPEKMYLWLRTYKIFEPAERPHGVRGKNKYSLLDLVKLAFIDNLQNLGMHLEYIRGIFGEMDEADVWRRLVNERDCFEADGAILFIVRETGVDWYRLEGGVGPERPRQAPHFRVTLLNNAEALRQFQERLKAPWSTLAINLGIIVDKIESLTGERLGQ